MTNERVKKWYSRGWWRGLTWGAIVTLLVLLTIYGATATPYLNEERIDAENTYKACRDASKADRAEEFKVSVWAKPMRHYSIRDVIRANDHDQKRMNYCALFHSWDVHGFGV